MTSFKRVSIFLGTVNNSKILASLEMKISVLPIAHRIKHLQPIFTIHKNRRFIVSGGMNGEMKFWNTNCDYIKTVKKHSGSITSIRFSQDGKYIASSGDDGKVFVFDSDGENTVHSIKHSSDVTHIEWMPEHLISTDMDGVIVITKIPEFKEFKRFSSHQDSIIGLAISNDNKYVCTFSEAKLILYENFQVKKEAEIDKGVIVESLNSRISFSPNNKYISVGLQFNNKYSTVDIFDMSLNRAFSLVGHVGPSEITVFCKHAFVKAEKFYIIAVASQDLSISFWSTANPKPFLLIKNFTESPVLDMFWEGLCLYASSYDGIVKRVEFSEDDLGKIEEDLNDEDDIDIAFCERNIEMQKNYNKNNVDLKERVEKEKMGEIKVNDKTIKEIIKSERENQVKESLIDISKPKRITPVSMDNKGAIPVSVATRDAAVVLFDTNVAEKLKLTKTEPFKNAIKEYTVELTSSKLMVSRQGKLFYSIEGVINKVCYNGNFLVVYTKYIQIYNLSTGCLVYPYISYKLAFLDILGSNLLLVSAYGEFVLFNMAKCAPVFDGKLSKTKGLTKIQLSADYCILAEYSDQEILYYSPASLMWLCLNPEFNSVTTNHADFLNDIDQTVNEIENAFLNYKINKDAKKINTVAKQMVGIVKRQKRLTDEVEYKLESVLQGVTDRKLKYALLEELNEEVFLQRFVEKFCMKYSM